MMHFLIFSIAVAQMANLMAEWLILAGAEIGEVQQRVEYDLEDVRPQKSRCHFRRGGRDPVMVTFSISIGIGCVNQSSKSVQNRRGHYTCLQNG